LGAPPFPFFLLLFFSFPPTLPNSMAGPKMKTPVRRPSPLSNFPFSPPPAASLHKEKDSTTQPFMDPLFPLPFPPFFRCFSPPLRRFALPSNKGDGGRTAPPPFPSCFSSFVPFFPYTQDGGCPFPSPPCFFSFPFFFGSGVMGTGGWGKVCSPFSFFLLASLSPPFFRFPRKQTWKELYPFPFSFFESISKMGPIVRRMIYAFFFQFFFRNKKACVSASLHHSSFSLLSPLLFFFGAKKCGLSRKLLAHLLPPPLFLLFFPFPSEGPERKKKATCPSFPFFPPRFSFSMV